MKRFFALTLCLSLETAAFPAPRNLIPASALPAAPAAAPSTQQAPVVSAPDFRAIAPAGQGALPLSARLARAADEQRDLLERGPRLEPAAASVEASRLFDRAVLPRCAASFLPQGSGALKLIALSAAPSDPPALRSPSGKSPPQSPKKRGKVKTIIVAILALALVGAIAYKVLIPRIDPVEPPPTIIDNNGKIELRLDPRGQVVPGQGELEVSLRGTGAAQTTSLSPSRTSAVTVAPDGSWLVWDLQKMQASGPRRYAGHALASAWRDGGRTLVLLDADGTARLLDLQTGHVRSMAQKTGKVVLYSFSADGRQLAFATSAGHVLTLDLTTAKSEAFLAQGQVIALASTPLGTLVAAQLAGKVLIWSVVPGQAPKAIAERGVIGASLLAADISSDGSRLLAAGYFGSAQGLIAVRTSDSKSKILSAEALDIGSARIASVAVEADGSRAAILANDGRLWIWFIDSGDTAFVGKTPNAATVAFSQDGAKIIVSGASGADIFTTPE